MPLLAFAPELVMVVVREIGGGLEDGWWVERII